MVTFWRLLRKAAAVEAAVKEASKKSLAATASNEAEINRER